MVQPLVFQCTAKDLEKFERDDLLDGAEVGGVNLRADVFRALYGPNVSVDNLPKTFYEPLPGINAVAGAAGMDKLIILGPNFIYNVTTKQLMPGPLIHRGLFVPAPHRLNGFRTFPRIIEPSSASTDLEYLGTLAEHTFLSRCCTASGLRHCRISGRRLTAAFHHAYRSACVGQNHNRQAGQ